MTLIGLGYRARAGKDTVGKYLVEAYGFHRVAFADVLKDVCSALTGLDAHDADFKYSTALLGKTGGQLLQTVGVTLRNLDENIWVEASRLSTICDIYDRVVVTDVRFENEAAAIKKLGGKLVEVYRNGLADDKHASESEGSRVTWDVRIHNTGTLAHLYQSVETTLGLIGFVH